MRRLALVAMQPERAPHSSPPANRPTANCLAAADPVASTVPLVSQPWHRHASAALEDHRFLLLVGDQGCGKTEFVHQACQAATGKPPQVVQGSPQTDKDSFFGVMTLEGDRTGFAPGPLLLACAQETWLLVEDIGSLHAANLSILLGMRHSDRIQVPVPYQEIRLPKAMRVVMTANRENWSCRSGLSALQSLVDGAVVLDVPEHSEAELQALLKAHCPGITKKEAARLLEVRRRFLDLANQDSESKKVPIGIRALVQTYWHMRKGLPEHVAIDMGIVGKFVLHREKYDAARLIHQVG
jgi:MoxR-like ATPase